MIETDGLTKSFGAHTAVDDVSLSVATGEVLGFLGPNGAGKSTTMKMITGFLSPTAGTARVAGYDVASRPIAAKRHFGYLPEGAPAYEDMPVRGFLGFVAGMRGLQGRAAAEAIDSVAETTSLQEVMAQPIATLSKGFRRRVALAQALVHDPPVLILDEPTDGLDPNQKVEMRGAIQRMARDKAIIVSTHVLEEVEAVCTRAAIIASGTLRADGPPQELVRRAANHNAVRLTLPASELEAAESALKGLDGVAAVERLASATGELAALRIKPAAGQTVAGPVAALAHERGWTVQGLQVETGRLEDVFRDITTAAA